MQKRSATLAPSLALLLGGCFSPNTANLIFKCDTSSDCTTGQQCRAGLCQPGESPADLAVVRWRLDYQGSFALHAITGSDTSHIWAVGDSSGTVRWNGSSWTSGTIASATPNTTLYAAWMRSGNEVAAVGQAGRTFINTSASSGGAWAAPTAGGSDLHAVWGRGTTELWAGGDDTSNLFYYQSSFWLAKRNLGSKLAGAWGNSNLIVLVGDSSKIGRVGNASTAFVADTVNGATSNLRAVWGISDSQLWAVGSGGVVGTASGTTWSLAVVAPGAQLNGVWASSASDIWAVGDASTVIHYNGTTWSAVSADAVAGYNLVGIWGADSQNIWVIGNRPAGSQAAIFRY
jgi:hypothetical protein